MLLLALFALAVSFETHNILTPITRTPHYIHYGGSHFDVFATTKRIVPTCGATCGCELADGVNFCRAGQWSPAPFNGTHLQFPMIGDSQKCVYAATGRPDLPIDFLHQGKSGLMYCKYTNHTFSCIRPVGASRLFNTYLLYIDGRLEATDARLMRPAGCEMPAEYWAVRDGYFCSIRADMGRPWVQTWMICWACSFCRI